MIIAIVGSRGFSKLDMVDKYVASLPADTVVVSGGAIGVDQAAEKAAKKRGLKTKIFPANWNKYGKRAGFLRNKEIVDAAQRVVIFWDGVSKGSKHSMDLAIAAGKPVEVCR